MPDHPSFPDTCTVVLRFQDGTLKGYNGFYGTHIIMNGRSLDLLPTNNFPDVGLQANALYTTFNMQGAYVDGNVVRGFIHLETGWMMPGTRSYYFYGSVAYAESVDGGNRFLPRTFAEKDLIYTSGTLDRYINSPKNGGTGNHGIVVGGNYVYLYVRDQDAERPGHARGPEICVARSRLADKGQPGTWSKWYRGSFSEPGIGGSCTGLPGYTTGANVIRFNADLLMAVPNEALRPLSVSLDGIHWTEFENYMFPWVFPIRQVDQAWRQWIGTYFSLVKDPVSQQFYLYHMYSPAGIDSWATMKRYLVRYPITFRLSQTAVPACQGRFTLVNYLSWENTDTWATIQPVDSGVYSPIGMLGYMSACPRKATVNLVDCMVIETGDHFITTLTECGAGKSAPDGSGKAVVFLGPVGYAYPTQVDNTIPLYRCYDAQRGDLFTSIRACSSSRYAVRLGYIFAQ